MFRHNHVGSGNANRRLRCVCYFGLFVICLVFRWRPYLGHLIILSLHTLCVWSPVAGKRNLTCVRLMDYRCTADLVGYSRQWKWAWPPLRKQHISNSHNYTHYTANMLQQQAQCDLVGRKIIAQDLTAHFTHSYPYLLETPHLVGLQRRLSSVLPVSKDERRRGEERQAGGCVGGIRGEDKEEV